MFADCTVASDPSGAAVGESCAVGVAVGGSHAGVKVGETGVGLGIATWVGDGTVVGAGVALDADTSLGCTAVRVAKILVMMTASVAGVSGVEPGARHPARAIPSNQLAMRNPNRLSIIHRLPIYAPGLFSPDATLWF
jgi:hypothetical protein